MHRTGRHRVDQRPPFCRGHGACTEIKAARSASGYAEQRSPQNLGGGDISPDGMKGVFEGVDVNIGLNYDPGVIFFRASSSVRYLVHAFAAEKKMGLIISLLSRPHTLRTRKAAAP